MTSPLKEITTNVQSSAPSSANAKSTTTTQARSLPTVVAKKAPPLVDWVVNFIRGNDDEHLKVAMFALYEVLSELSDEKVIEVGGHLAVIRIMNKRPHCLNLQLLGMEVLFRFLFANRSEETKSALVKANAIDVILWTMKDFPWRKISSFQESAYCGVLPKPVKITSPTSNPFSTTAMPWEQSSMPWLFSLRTQRPTMITMKLVVMMAFSVLACY